MKNKKVDGTFILNQEEVAGVLTKSITKKLPILIVGTPGAGKTAIVNQVSDKLGYRVVTECLSIADPLDFKGALFHHEGRAEFLPSGTLNEIVDTDEKIVYFLDDIGQGAPATQAGAMSLVHSRKVGKHDVGKNVVFVGATNRAEDMAGVSYLLEPLKSRFSSIIHMGIDSEKWLDWARNNDVPVDLMSFIRFKPSMLDEFKPTRDLENTPNPRSIVAAGEHLKIGYSNSILYKVLKGSCGATFSNEFMTFLDIFKELPDIDNILKNPETHELPSKLDVKYAVMSALTKRMNTDNFKACTTFLDRMGIEFLIGSVKDAISRNPNICESTHFTEFSVEYKDYLI